MGPAGDGVEMSSEGMGRTAGAHGRDAADHFQGNIAWLLWSAAREVPDRPAVTDSGGTVDYATLCAGAAVIARWLEAEGVLPGDRVGILLPRSAAAAAAFFGVTAAGAIAVNVNETLKPAQIEHQLGHAGAKLLLTSPALLARLHRPLETDVRVLMLDDAALWPASPPPSRGAGGLATGSGARAEPSGAEAPPTDSPGGPPAGSITANAASPGGLPEPTAAAWPTSRTAHDVAQIIYTSGSTGRPKGVTVSHGNLHAGAWAVASYLGIGPDDRIASLLPFSFDYGLNQLLVAVRQRAHLVIERSVLPPRIAATLRAGGVTVLPAVPPLWLQLLGTPGFADRPIETLRIMTNTGGRLSTDAVRRLRRAQPQARLFLMYGLTEAFRSTYLPPEEVDRRPDSIGRAIPGAEILVLREDGTPCGPGEVGELVHRGPTVALGYWADPEATARVFRPNPLRPPDAPDAERVVYSGDLVRRDEDGFLYFVGRRDGLIKTLGYRVSPDEVAEALYASGQVAEAVVAAEPDERRGSRIVAHVVLRPGGTIARLEEHCRRELPGYMQPARYVAHTALPRTPTGKFDVRALAR